MSISAPQKTQASNPSLDRIAAELKSNARPVDLATAQAVIMAVEGDRTLTSKEAATLDDIFTNIAFSAEPGVNGASEYGKSLLKHYAVIVTSALRRAQNDHPLAWLSKLVPFDLFPALPSYIAVDENPLGGVDLTMAAKATREAIDAVTARYHLDKIVTDGFPAAIEIKADGSEKMKLHDDVNAEYDKLREGLQAGTIEIDEHDPLSPMRAFLEANYAS